MSIPPEAVSLVASLIEAGARGIFELLSDDGKAAVREQLTSARERLPAPGAIGEATEAVIARHAMIERAHVQATAETVRSRYHLTDTVQQAANVNSWPFVVEVPRATWDALHAIGGES